jgi:chemotaxis protein CheY-P-specific phosphatase CheC
MEQKRIFSKEEIDFLHEMFSIGAGNAVAAFSQMFGAKVDMEMPVVTVMDVKQIWDSKYYDSEYVVCTITKMQLFGEVIGNLFYVLKGEYVKQLIEYMEKTAFPKMMIKIEEKDRIKWQDSMLEEMGNIFEGTYLGAISRFCKINIIHTIPVLEKDKLYAFLEIYIRDNQVHIDDHFILVENRFIIDEKPFEGLLIINLTKDTTKRFIQALKDAKDELRKKESSE